MAMGNWARLIEKLAKLYIWSKLCLSIDGVKYPFFFFFCCCCYFYFFVL